MKKAIFFTVFFLFGALKINAQNNKTTFASLDGLKEAYVIGTGEYYESVYREHGYKLFAGEDTISFPYDAATRMGVVGGNFWVIQKAGTKFIIKDGKVRRRYDCRNKITGFCRLYPPAEKPKVSTENLTGNISFDIFHHFDPLTIKTDWSSFPSVPVVESDPFWKWLIKAAVVVLFGFGGYKLCEMLSRQHNEQQPTVIYITPPVVTPPPGSPPPGTPPGGNTGPAF